MATEDDNKKEQKQQDEANDKRPLTLLQYLLDLIFDLIKRLFPKPGEGGPGEEKEKEKEKEEELNNDLGSGDLPGQDVLNAGIAPTDTQTDKVTPDDIAAKNPGTPHVVADIPGAQQVSDSQSSIAGTDKILDTPATARTSKPKHDALVGSLSQFGDDLNPSSGKDAPGGNDPTQTASSTPNPLSTKPEVKPKD